MRANTESKFTQTRPDYYVLVGTNPGIQENNFHSSSLIRPAAGTWSELQTCHLGTKPTACGFTYHEYSSTDYHLMAIPFVLERLLKQSVVDIYTTIIHEYIAVIFTTLLKHLAPPTD